MIERRAHDAGAVRGARDAVGSKARSPKTIAQTPNPPGTTDGAGDEQPEDRRAERVAEDHEAEPRDLRKVRERRARRCFGDDVVDVATPIVEVLIEEVIFEPGHTDRFDAGSAVRPERGQSPRAAKSAENESNRLLPVRPRSRATRSSSCARTIFGASRGRVVSHADSRPAPVKSRPPRISPDGSTIAFVARDEGGPEVYTMPAGGGVATRLTFLGRGRLFGLVLDARRLVHPLLYRRERAVCEGDAGLPNRGRRRNARTALARSRSSRARSRRTADGRMVIGRNNDDPARWKRYRGGTAGDIWIDRDGDGIFHRLISLVGNPVWPIVGRRTRLLPLRPRRRREHLLGDAERAATCAATRTKRNTSCASHRPMGPRSRSRPGAAILHARSRNGRRSRASTSTRPRARRNSRDASSRSAITSNTSRRAPRRHVARARLAVARRSRCRSGKKPLPRTARGAACAIAPPSGCTIPNASSA